MMGPETGPVPRLPRLDGRRVVVVGGGFGGLAAACYLAQAGAEVALLEKNEQLGGRASRLQAQGFTFDMGPSWYLMPDAWERFFSHFGKRPADYYRARRLDPHYRIFFKDGDRVDITGDRAAMRDLFEGYETGAGAALDRYLAQSRQTYERAMPGFVYTDRPRLRDYLTLDVARQARGLSLLGSMDRFVGRYFQHPKLRQIMAYSLVFLGGEPRNTPALYHLMGHVDFNLGVFYPEGGIGALVDGVAALAAELGVRVHLDRPATAIRRRPGGGLRVETASGPLDADAVVAAADYHHVEQDLLDPADRQYSPGYWKRRTWAPSAYLLYLGVSGELPELAHHSLVLPTDWSGHFRQLFQAPAWPEDPAYYLCMPSRSDDTVAPPGTSNLFALVPVAAGLEDTEAGRARYRDLLLADIARHTGVDLRQRIVFEQSFSLRDFSSRYNAARGTALGLAHTLTQSAFGRPARRSRRLPGLYFAGAYTTPGIGMPMCLISGEHTAATLARELGSMGSARSARSTGSAGSTGSAASVGQPGTSPRPPI